MPSGPALLSGLMGGFVQTHLQEEARQDDKKYRDKMLRWSIMQQIDPSRLSPEQQAAYASEVDDILGNGGKGKKGAQGGPMAQLMGKIAPMFQRKQGGQPAPQQQGPQAAMPSPPSPNGSSSVQSDPVAAAKANPGAPQAQVITPPPAPSTSQSGRAKNAPALAAPPKPTVGSMFAHPPSDEAAAQKKYTEAKAYIEKDLGRPLTADENRKLTEHYMGTGSLEDKKGMGRKVAEVQGEDGKPYNLIEYADGTREMQPAVPKPEPKKSATQEKFDQRVKNRMAANPNETQEQAERSLRILDNQKEQAEALSKSLGNKLKKQELTALQQRITEGNSTVKDSRYLLTAAREEAKARVAAARQAVTAGDDTNPDIGKTTQAIEDEVLNGFGVDPEKVRQTAPGSAPRQNGSEGGQPNGGFDWNALPKAQ